MVAVKKIALLRSILRPPSQAVEEKVFGLGLGAQRCGSTWIGKYLSNHPDFCICSTKEMHIFDTIRREKEHPLLRKTTKKNNPKLGDDQMDLVRISQGEKQYFEFFEERLEPSHRAFGEITPEYSLLGQRFLKIIGNSHENIRFFVSLRRPVGRYLSALTYYGRKRPKFDIEKHYLKGLDKKLFCHYTRYTENIQNLLSVVPKEKIYFFFYEDLFNGTNETLFELCNHLKISQIAPEEINLSLSKVVNNTTSTEEIRKPTHEEMKTIYKKFEKEYENLSSLISKKLPEQWLKDIASYG